jgi:FkbM family methyltransferase
MLNVLRRLRNRLLLPVLTELRESEARKTAELHSRLEIVEARIAASEQSTSTMIELSSQAMRSDFERLFRPIFFQNTCVKAMLAETSEGKFLFDVKDDIIGRYISYGGWEAAETNWIKTIVRDGDYVIDAGANLGWYTVVTARLVGTEGCILAFEPDPRNFELLTKNVTENGFADRCKLFKLALLEDDGACKLEQSSDNFGDHRVRFVPPGDFANNSFAEDQRPVISVQCQSLDNALQAAGLEDKRVRLLKMDTQGSEISILKGARKTLAKTDYVLTEYWPYALARSTSATSEFIVSISEFFNEFCRFTTGELKFQPIDRLSDDITRPMTNHSGADAYSMYIFRKADLP